MSIVFLQVFSVPYDRREIVKTGGRPQRAGRRLTPDAEALEVRRCPSALAPSLATDRLARAAVVSDHGGHQERRLDLVRDDVAGIAIPLKHKVAAVKQTIYVKPGGKSTTGKTAKKPLGSFTKALKLAKPGATIVLEPGTYKTQLLVKHKTGLTLLLEPGTYTANISVSSSTNLTIKGAANQSSVLAPASQDAIDVYLSSKVTVENVWLKAQGSSGRGLAVAGSSVDVQNIKTDGTLGDGVVVLGYQGSSATLNATSSQFDAVQTGDGLDLQSGSAATINGCTFDGDGTAPNVSQTSDGLVLSGNATANISNSQFTGNTNGGLVASQSSGVTAQGCTFSSNQKGDGALFLGQSTANLMNDTFASNGEVVGPTTGLNGVEFNANFTGTAVVSGNSFENNTGDGLFIGSSPSTIQVVNNVFNNNFVGLALYANGTSVNANVQSNTFEVPSSAPSSFGGLFAEGSGVTATVGGPGNQGNVFDGFATGFSIFQSNGEPSQDLGNPNLNILANTFE